MERGTLLRQTPCIALGDRPVTGVGSALQSLEGNSPLPVHLRVDDGNLDRSARRAGWPTGKERITYSGF